MVRETRRAGERGDARAFEYALAVPAGSQGPPAPLRRRCLPGRCSGGALVAPRRRLRPEGRGLGRGERRGRERDGARLPNEPHGLRLGRRGHHLGRGGGQDGEVGRGKRQTCRLAPLRRDECVGWPRAGGGRRRPRSPRGGAHRSPLTSPPPPVAPHARVPPQGRKAARSTLASAHLAITPAAATKEVASAAQTKTVRLVWEPRAVPLSRALLPRP